MIQVIELIFLAFTHNNEVHSMTAHKTVHLKLRPQKTWMNWKSNIIDFTRCHPSFIFIWPITEEKVPNKSKQIIGDFTNVKLNMLGYAVNICMKKDLIIKLKMGRTAVKECAFLCQVTLFTSQTSSLHVVLNLLNRHPHFYMNRNP